MDLLSFCTEPLTSLSELSVSLKWRRFCVYLGCGAVAETQGFYLVCIWGRLAHLLGGEGGGGRVVLKLDVFSHCYAVFCGVCIEAMIHSVENVPSEEQLNWWL